MRTDSERKPSLELFLDLFNGIMVLVYLALGSFIFFAPAVLNDRPLVVKKTLGAMLFLFGLFRLTRLILKLKTKRSQDEE